MDIELLHTVVAGPVGVLGAALWGLAWGSFFNVLVTRLPAGESVVRPASHCRSCGHPVAWYDNIPVLSYLLLRGRCRRCETRFSPRYMLVELLVGVLAVAMHQLYVVPAPDGIPLALARFVITSLFCGVLVALAFIDLDTMHIPDAVTYPAIPICTALSVFMGLPRLWDGLVGGVAGYLLIRLIADGYELVTGRRGMGYGDAKLLAMIGALLGWQVLLPTMFLSALQGSVIGIAVLVIVRRRRQAQEPPAAADSEPDDEEEPDEPESLRHAAIPFGPFISLAAIEIILLQDFMPQLFPYLW